MHPAIQTEAVAGFSCLGADCPDTCCQGWGMQLTRETVEKYAREAPELSTAVTQGEADFIMRRDPATDHCVKFTQGLCGIHRQYGEAFLGDACHFYPRITRALGDTTHMTAALSCPEAARRMLFANDAFAHRDATLTRVPYSLKNYLPQGMSPANARMIHEAFLAMALDDRHSAGWNLLRISAVVQALALQPMSVWTDALVLYAGMADSRVPAADGKPEDLFNLLHALYGLARAAGPIPTRLKRVIDPVATALGVNFNASGGIELVEDSTMRGLKLLAHQRAQADALQPILRRYLAAQISQALFPFSGFGETLPDRMTVIGVRFATIRLMLSALPEAPEESAIVQVVYSVSRFLDHLADPTLSLQIYRETGWVRESRLRALIGE